MLSHKDPFSPIEQDLSKLNMNLQTMIGAKNPVLYAAAEHLFHAKGKRIRPSLILIIAKALNSNKQILPEHRRLAEITEIIHTASLVHDDIIDNSETRRGINTVHNTFNNKIAILAGDFLFAQSSWYLANLNNLSVVKIISKVIIDFAEGEVRQGSTNFDTSLSINDYIEKSFYKTASLIASSCQGAAIISRCNPHVINNLYLYGKHIGLSFQIIDDILDIISSTEILGKPQGSDIKNGNLTAPLMFTLTENTTILPLIYEEFENTINIYDVISIIKNTKGIQKAKDLAEEHLQIAIDLIKEIEMHIQYEDILPISCYMINRIR